VRVAAVQFRAQGADALAQLVALTERAAVDADLVVLPEMAATGYLFEDPAAVATVAEPAGGRTFEALAPLAKGAGCWIVAGFPERSGDRLYNSAAVIDPSGVLRFVYRKTLLFDADLSWATPGDSGYAHFDADAGRFGVGICMDLNDDGFVAWCAMARLDVVALPTCWVDEGYAVWPYWHQRMLGVRGALVAADTWGAQLGTQFAGRSAVLHRGRLIAGTGALGDGVVRAKVSV
jgi:predicted amidohydrolase